jgi:molybdate transport system substrate-binding protein
MVCGTEGYWFEPVRCSFNQQEPHREKAKPTNRLRMSHDTIQSKCSRFSRRSIVSIMASIRSESNISFVLQTRSIMLSSLRHWILLTALVCLACSGCRKEPPPASAPAVAQGTKTSPPSAENRTLTFSIAASTKETIETLAASFTERTKIVVKTNPGPSSGLANQILEGAPADLFLSANRQWADKVQSAGLAETMQPFLTNKLVLIVPKENPASVKSPQDLSATLVKKIALAGEKVPAGMYADQALTKLGLLDDLVAAGKIARGQDVRSALSYVERGEAEAGIVYSTDVATAPNVKVVYEFDPSLHEEIVYVLVLLKHGKENPQAKAFYDFLLSDEAFPVFAKAGFERYKSK